MKMFLVILTFAAGLWAAPVKYIEPETPGKVPYSASLAPGGALVIRLGGRRHVVKADLSLRPGWARLDEDAAENASVLEAGETEFKAEVGGLVLVRRIEAGDEAVTVTDSIANPTGENIPLMYRQYLTFDSVKECRLCGRRVFSSRGSGGDSINSTAIVMPEGGGSLGLLALDDVFRVHFKAFAARKMYGIGDDSLVIKPGETREMSFAVFPSQHDDYYSQINAMRRYLGVNYEISCGFTMLQPYPKGVITFSPDHDRLGKDSTVEELRDWLNCKAADYICDGAVSQLGEPQQGTAWLEKCKPQIHKDFYAKIRQARPSAKMFHYFHCYIEDRRSPAEGIEGDKCLKPNGEQGDYRNPNMPLYLPLEGGRWAECKEKVLHKLKDDYGVDGIFWDEFPYSAMKYHYGPQWDGVSCDINPKSHEISRLKSSVPLLTLPWRRRMVEWIADNGLMLIANGGGGYTRTMTELFRKHRFIAFEETGSISNLYITHLSTPIGLGDHITERNETDCYRNIVKHLDYGCLYFYYHEQVAPFTHETIGKYMFPITPVELHEGYILGKERILANRSGVYGFGDKSGAEVHFFGADGREVKRKARRVRRNGKFYYKVELGEGESCAIVRK